MSTELLSVVPSAAGFLVVNSLSTEQTGHQVLTMIRYTVGVDGWNRDPTRQQTRPRTALLNGCPLPALALSVCLVRVPVRGPGVRVRVLDRNTGCATTVVYGEHPVLKLWCGQLGTGLVSKSVR